MELTNRQLVELERSIQENADDGNEIEHQPAFFTYVPMVLTVAKLALAVEVGLMCMVAVRGW